MAVNSRSAAVLGHPVEHSLSPVLHLAAYRALGLVDWTYSRIDCSEQDLKRIVENSPPDRIGYSVTMPGKIMALKIADEATERAATVGAANTLVRTPSGWRADCTDIDGARDSFLALGDFPQEARGVLLGGGGTARAVCAGFAAAGGSQLTIATRRDNAGPVAECARVFGLRAETMMLHDSRLPEAITEADVLINTLPLAGITGHAHLAGYAQRLVDVLYAPWPTPAAAVALDAGIPTVGGDVMLLHQAFGQVQQFTGRTAPRDEMAAALSAALNRH